MTFAFLEKKTTLRSEEDLMDYCNSYISPDSGKLEYWCMPAYQSQPQTDHQSNWDLFWQLSKELFIQYWWLYAIFALALVVLGASEGYKSFSARTALAPYLSLSLGLGVSMTIGFFAAWQETTNTSAPLLQFIAYNIGHSVVCFLAWLVPYLVFKRRARPKNKIEKKPSSPLPESKPDPLWFQG